MSVGFAIFRRPKLLARDFGDQPGAGAFMRDAELLGYLVEGLEPDPDAVDACRMSGFNVRQGSVPSAELPADAYEHVVLSHVVEHLHYPVAALEAILRSLKAGGRIWIAMPNLGASGLKRLGNWRGLEVPRHLVLYDQRSTNALLASELDFGTSNFSILVMSGIFSTRLASKSRGANYLRL